jgi:hypothetical protein
MILAACIDCGVPLDYVREQLSRMNIEGLRVDTERVRRSGIACTKMKLSWTTPKQHRHLSQLVDTITAGEYSTRVFERSVAILKRLADVEARVHSIPVEKVHFHEVGAVDTLIDIVGTCCCLEYLDIDTVLFSTLTIGKGTVECAHGVMPVPVPATSMLIEGLGVRGVDVHTEILTPTGAAILTTLGTQRTGGVEGVIGRTGYGCGEREFFTLPNILAVRRLQSPGVENRGYSEDRVWVLQSDMDHVSGEVMSYTAQKCMEQGAYDVSWGPVMMKKGRPGYRITVICHSDNRQQCIETVMKQTRTLGVRYWECVRTIAERQTRQSTFMEEEVVEKECRIGSETFTKLEFDSCIALAEKTGRPVWAVVEEYIREKR